MHPGQVLRVPLAAILLTCVVGCQSTRSTVPPPPVATSEAPAAPAEPIRLTVIGTNDLHGWAQPHTATLRDGTLITEGGLATFAGYLAILRAANPGGTLLLDGGDMFQGTLSSNLGEGAVIIDAYNHLGYQAVAIGNHDFDYGPVGPSPIASQPGMDPLGALKARVAQARFPFLAANVIDAKTRVWPDWLSGNGSRLVEVKGVKVGLIGLSTPRTPETTNRANVEGLRFGGLILASRESARRLRAQGATVIIAVAHVGGQCRAWNDPHDVSSCERQEELFAWLHELPPGTIDAVVAGHTHQTLGHFVAGTPVIESKEYGRHFGTIDLFVDPSTHRVIPERTVITPAIAVCERVDEATGQCDPKALRERPEVKLVPATFLGQPVVKDAALEQLIAPALASAEAERSRPLGLTVPQPLRRNFLEESALGDLVTDSLRELMRADVALLNSGGLRADLKAGELRAGDLYEVIPFDNTIATLTLTGEQLRRLLDHVYGTARQGVYQVSGLKLELARCPGPGRLQRVLLPNGRALSPEKRYRVVMPDFLARGGNGLGPLLETFPEGSIDLGLDQERSLRDALVAFWQARKQPLVAPAPGRMAFVGKGPCASEGGGGGEP